jgi:hypothetical protein
MKQLTKEQLEKLKEYQNEYLNIGLSTEPCDRTKAEAALTASYVYAHDVLNEKQKSKTPNFIWADSPKQGLVLAAKIKANDKELTEDIIKKTKNEVSYGSFECHWVAFYAYISEVLENKPQPIIEIAKNIVKNCGFYWIFNDTCVVCEKPVKIIMKEIPEKGLVPHADGEMAVQYKDGTGVFYDEGQKLESKMSKLFNDKFKQQKV